jgi:hypothetical protein
MEEEITQAAICLSDHGVEHAQHGVVLVAVGSGERTGLDYIGSRQSSQQRKQCFELEGRVPS